MPVEAIYGSNRLSRQLREPKRKVESWAEIQEKIKTKRACDSCFWVTGSQVLTDDAGGAGLFTGPERREAGTTETSRTRSGKSPDRPQEEEHWGQCRNPGGETRDSQVTPTLRQTQP